MSQAVQESSLRSQQDETREPQDYERQYGVMTPKEEAEFESWARRLVPSFAKEAF